MHTPQIELPDNFRPHHKGLTHRDINQANEQFWSEQKILMHSRITDESLIGQGLAHLMSEYDRGVPVRAPRPFEQMQLSKDITDLLSTEGVAADAIFGWFFGHEHRCALYRDTETSTLD
jgi:hypothetical protein